MPRTVSQQQLANVDATRTKPVFLVAWEHSGVEELIACTVGEVVFDSRTYTPQDVTVSSIQNGRSASLVMPASPTRVAQSQNGTWRNGFCKIYAIPAAPTDALTFLEADAILVLQGEIRSSALSGNQITVVCEHVGAGFRLSPRYTFDAVCNHLPPAGTVISWEGDTIVLGAPR